MTPSSLSPIPRHPLAALGCTVAFSTLASDALVLCAVGRPQVFPLPLAAMLVAQAAINGFVLVAYFKLAQAARPPVQTLIKKRARIRLRRTLFAAVLTAVILLPLALRNDRDGLVGLASMAAAGGLVSATGLILAVLPVFALGMLPRSEPAALADAQSDRPPAPQS